MQREGNAKAPGAKAQRGKAGTKNFEQKVTKKTKRRRDFAKLHRLLGRALEGIYITSSWN